jgi:hypothetical protein
LRCVELSKDGSVCGVDGCQYQAAERNGISGNYRCIAHNQNWYPKPDENNNRGHYLIGPECLRPIHGQRATCVCDDAACKGIGYSSYMARFPKSQINDVILAISAKDQAKTKIETASQGCRIAPWHFDPKHRYYDEGQGTWKLKQYPNAKKFRDSDGKYWHGKPPPNYPPKKFKEEELDGERTLPREKWRQCKTLPPWVAVLARSERKGTMRPLVAAVALPTVTRPTVTRQTVTLASCKKSHSELEDDVKEEGEPNADRMGRSRNHKC